MLNCESSQWCTVNHNHDVLLNVALLYCEPSPWRFMNRYHVFKNHRHDVLWITVTMMYCDWCELQSPWCTVIGVNYSHHDVLWLVWITVTMMYCDWCELHSPWCTVSYHHQGVQQHVLTIIFKSTCISSCCLALSLCTKWFCKHKVYSYTHIYRKQINMIPPPLPPLPPPPPSAPKKQTKSKSKLGGACWAISLMSAFKNVVKQFLLRLIKWRFMRRPKAWVIRMNWSEQKKLVG